MDEEDSIPHVTFLEEQESLTDVPSDVKEVIETLDTKLKQVNKQYAEELKRSINFQSECTQYKLSK